MRPFEPCNMETGETCEACTEKQRVYLETLGWDYWMRIIGMVPYVFGSLFIPCIIYSAHHSLAAFRWNIQNVASLLTARQQQGDVPLEYCSASHKERAPVYLLTSTVNALASSQSSGEGENEADAPIAEQLQPLLSHVTRQVLYQRHWAISIRGVVYEVLRKKNTKIIELKVQNASARQTPDVLGIPLSAEAVEELGVTLLSDREVKTLIDTRMDHMVRSDKLTYHAFLNNCQLFWSKGLLQTIVCQCPDQERLKLPPSSGLWLSGVVFNKKALGNQIGLIMQVLQRKLWPFTWTKPLVSRSYWLLNLHTIAWSIFYVYLMLTHADMKTITKWQRSPWTPEDRYTYLESLNQGRLTTEEMEELFNEAMRPQRAASRLLTQRNLFLAFTFIDIIGICLWRGYYDSDKYQYVEILLTLFIQLQNNSMTHVIEELVESRNCEAWIPVDSKEHIE